MLSHLGSKTAVTNRSHWHSCKAAISHEQGKKQAPPATLWSGEECPASRYSQLHFSAAHGDAILERVLWCRRWRGKTTLLTLTCYEKQFWHEYLL